MKLRAFVALLPLVLLAALAMPARADVSKLNDAGKAAYERGDYAAAERLFREALRATPEEPLLHYHLAVVLTRLGQWKEAKEAYERTLALGPSSSLAGAAREGLRTVTPLTRPRAVAPAVPEPDPGSRRAVWRRPPPSDTIVATRLGNNWYVDVVVNDGRPARFLVDTGAFACLVSPRLAEALGITPGPGARMVPMMGIGGRTAAPLVTLQSVRVGDVEATDVAAVVHDVAGPGDGILGNTFRSRFTMTLDPGRGLLTLQPK
jgi:clan AA aspartic protease (TIGR02281 family)